MDLQLSDFEKRVLKGLADTGFCDYTATYKDDFNSEKKDVSEIRLGLAVSGGADSISLLYSMSEIFRNSCISLYVITVNHFIRPDEETCGDAAFVLAQCQALKKKGYNIQCELVELERGEVSKVAGERAGGIEEAARFLRYKAFDNFIKKYKLQALCLAHNKNDQLETLLMRFLQGSGLDAAGGIQRRRGLYLRPLLDIERSDIEMYLRERKLSWRMDASNTDTAYLRNRIRKNLVPLLNENFPGWKKSLLSGSQKAQMDSEIISQEVDKIPLDLSLLQKGQVSCQQSLFASAPEGVQLRILVKMCNLLGEESRIPFHFLKDVVSCAASLTPASKEAIKKEFTKYYSGLEISQKKDKLFVKKCNKNHTDLVFFDIIEESGEYNFPFGRLNADAFGKISINNLETELQVDFPFVLRNIMAGDELLCADGKMKALSDIYSDWKVSEQERLLIPLIQKLEGDGEIKAVLAAFLGYKDWIVK